jgi:peptidoglycan LD-endopeptidase LytH
MLFKNINKLTYQIVSVLTISVLLGSCVGKQGVKAIFQKRTPYEAYEHNLREANLHRTALGLAWIQAGQQALRDSLSVKLPFQETAYFRADKPTATGYSFLARQGELIDIKITTRTNQDVKLFLDLFELNTDIPRQAKHVAAADTTSLNVEYQVDDNLAHLVRVQPELLRSGSYTITIVTRPSVSFPVQGKDSRAVQSFWGADRDAGARRHEGVDIFAPRGTPAIAGTKGVVTRVNDTPIGGKVVWVSDLNNRQNLYYAHLDSQLVQPGQQVEPGDTLGLIGNTGNARTTVPHLHFGIYRFGRGAVDPFPFINDRRPDPIPVTVAESMLGNWGRTAKNKTIIRFLPEAKAEVVATLDKNTALQILGGSGNWYRVQLPDGRSGYLTESGLEGLNKPLRTEKLKTDLEVMQLPDSLASPIAMLPKDSTLTVMAVYQLYNLVKLPDGTFGWVVAA